VRTRSRIAEVVHRTRSIAKVNAVLVANSGAVAIGNGSTAILGFAYWWLAARFISPEAVGISSALISAMGLIGQLGEGGTGTLLMGQMSVHEQRRRHGLAAAAGLITIVSCSSVAVICLGIARAVMPGRELFSSGPWIPSLLLLGCGTTGLALVIDHAFVGLFLSQLLMYRNMIFSVTKLLLLLGIHSIWNFCDDITTIVLSWVVGIVASCVVIVGLALRRGSVLICRPDFRLLLSLLPTFLSHHSLNVMAQAPPLAIPMVVSVVVSPTANAAFYTVWMLLIIASMVPGALTNVLYTIGTNDRHALAPRLRFSLLLSLAFSAGVSLVFYAFAHQILETFNHTYALIATSSLQLLGLSLLSGTIRFHYIAIVRVHNQMRAAFTVLAASGIGSIAFATYGGWAFGLRGLTIGWMLAGFIEAAFMLNTVVEVGWRAPHRTISGMIFRSADR
jgi:O-antigen/teichoic acid export membrane protein